MQKKGSLHFLRKENQLGKKSRLNWDDGNACGIVMQKISGDKGYPKTLILRVNASLYLKKEDSNREEKNSSHIVDFI